MTDEPIPLVCSPITRMRISGSPQRACSECDGPIWVSPTMVDKVDNGQMRPICIPCATPLIEAGPQFQIHPDQAEELFDVGLLGFAARFTDEMNINPQKWFDYEPGARRMPDPLGWESRRSPRRDGNRAQRRARGD